MKMAKLPCAAVVVFIGIGAVLASNGIRSQAVWPDKSSHSVIRLKSRVFSPPARISPFFVARLKRGPKEGRHAFVQFWQKPDLAVAQALAKVV